MTEAQVDSLKQKPNFEELENLPETIEDLEKDPILKPLLEFHKQASMLVKEDKLEHQFLINIKDELDKDLLTGIYDNSYIVKKFQNLQREYDRLILIYSRYTDLADEKIVEIKKIVEKYYVTKKVHEKGFQIFKEEFKLKDNEIKEKDESIKNLKQMIKEKEGIISEMEKMSGTKEVKEIMKSYPYEDLEEEIPEEEEEEEEEELPAIPRIPKEAIKKAIKKKIGRPKKEKEEDEESMDEYLKRKTN